MEPIRGRAARHACQRSRGTVIVATRWSFARRVDAKRWEADQLAKLDTGAWIDPTRGRITFAALAEWQASRGHLAVRSQETTRFLLDKYVLPEIGAFPISGISAADVERAMSAMTARGLATATRRRALSMIRLVFDYAIRDRRLSANVARMVSLPRGGPSASRTGYDPSSSADWSWRCRRCASRSCCSSARRGAGSRRWPRCGSTTSCKPRTGSACACTARRRSPSGPAGRCSGRPRPTRPGPCQCRRRWTDEYVRTRVAGTTPGGYLFPSPTGGVWTNTNFRARSGWMEATRRAGVEGTTIHDLRHTAASLLIAAGADVKAVQVILGHSTATMTMDLYGHLFSEATWQAMERLPAIPLTEAPLPALPQVPDVG